MAILLVDPHQHQLKSQHHGLLFSLAASCVFAVAFGWLWQHQSLMPHALWIKLLIVLVVMFVFLFGKVVKQFITLKRFQLLSQRFSGSHHHGMASDELEQKRFDFGQSKDGLWQSIVAGLGVVGLGGMVSGFGEGGLVIAEVLFSVAGLAVTAYEISATNDPKAAHDGALFERQPQAIQGEDVLMSVQKDDTTMDKTSLRAQDHSTNLEDQITAVQIEQNNQSSAIQESLFEQGDQQDDLLKTLDHAVPQQVVHR